MGEANLLACSGEDSETYFRLKPINTSGESLVRITTSCLERARTDTARLRWRRAGL